MVYKPRKVNHHKRARKVDSSLATIAGTSLFGIFLALLFYVFRDSTEGKYLSLSSVDPLTYILFTITGIMLFITVLSQQAGLGSLLVCYFLFVSCAFIAILNQSTGLYPWLNLNSLDYVTGTLLIFIAFSVSLIGGKVLSLLESMRSKTYRGPDRTPPLPVTIAPGNRSTIVFFGFLIVSAFCLIYSASFILHPRASNEQSGGDGLQVQIASIGRSIAMILMLYSFAISKNSSSKLDAKKWKSIHYCMIFYCIIWFNPISNPRYQFVALCLSLLFIYYRNIGSAAKSGILLCLTLMNFFAFGKIKYLLDQPSGGHPDYVFRVDFDSFQCATVVFGYVKGHGFTGVADLLATIFFFIPRALWQTKARSLSTLAFDSFGYPYSNVSYPLVMNFYAMGGYITLIVGGLLIGYFLSAYETKNSKMSSPNFISYQTLFMAALVGYLPIIMRGSLVSVVSGFGFTLLGIGALTLMANMRQGRPPGRFKI